MKTLIPLAVVILCVYYYVQTHQQAPPPPPPVVAAAPKPTPRKVYYHSPLDAPAMSTGTHAGFGYSSKDQYTNWRGSHLSDGAGPHTVVRSDTPEPETDDSDSAH